jgi:plasmid stabilization system protein ParE
VSPVRYDPRAREEFLSAVAWYAERNQRAAERFFALILDSETSIQNAPRSWPFAPQVPQQLGVRRLVLHDFPYSMVYLELDTEIVIVAVAHAKRRPGYWRNRLPPPR